MKGTNFLKITGIFMIIGGALGILSGFLGLGGIAGAAAYFDIVEEMGMMDQIYALAAASVLCLVGGILEVIAGIIGIKNCNNPARAKTCIIWGIIVTVISVVGNITAAIGGTEINVLYVVTGLILPVLYIIGGYLNFKQNQTHISNEE